MRRGRSLPERTGCGGSRGARASLGFASLRGAGWRLGSLLLALAAPASGLVVEADGDEVLRAPGPGTGFDHVGKIRETTGVYLGDGWVLTAGHVGAGELRLDGAGHPAVPDSWTPLRGPAGGSHPDLGVFRVAPSPPLPRLAIAGMAPRTGERLLLVGCGSGRGERFEWDGRVGFRWAGLHVRRWGTNRVAAVGLEVPGAGASTRVFATLFSAGEQWEAQAAIGDSGGAAFVSRRGAWKLAGIMVSVVSSPGQPPQTAVHGNETYLADLSVYRDEILALTGLARPL